MPALLQEVWPQINQQRDAQQSLLRRYYNERDMHQRYQEQQVIEDARIQSDKKDDQQLMFVIIAFIVTMLIVTARKS